MQFSLVALVGFVAAVALVSFLAGRRAGPPGASGQGVLGRMGASAGDALRDIAGGSGAGAPAFEIDLNAASGSSRAPSGASGSSQGHSPLAPLSPARRAPPRQLYPGVNASSSGAGSGASATAASAGKITAAPPSAQTSAPSRLSSSKSSSTRPSAIAPCDFSSSAAPQETARLPSPAAQANGGQVLMSEIAWMGTKDGSQNEWMELENRSDRAVPLEGWQMANRDGDMNIMFGNGHTIGAKSFFLLERTDDATLPGVPADILYTGSLSNGGESLKLFDAACGLVDAVDAHGGWPGGDNHTKQTLERDAQGLGWHTSSISGGTPRAANSPPAAPAAQSATGTSPRGASSYPLGVSLEGDGGGVVQSESKDIHCGFHCSTSYPEGSAVKFTATADSNSQFLGWAGACSGVGLCTVVVKGTTALIARFGLLVPLAPSAPPVIAPVASPSPVPTTTTVPSAPGLSHVIIFAVQTTGGPGKTDNDFIKLQNPSGTSVDVGGWKLRKRTQSGTESSVRVLPQGSAIPVGGYFVWANSGNGFSETIGANTSSTQILADDSSIALLDAAGTMIDQVAWGSGHVNPFVEGIPYPQNPGPNQMLVRNVVGGVVQDTDQNAIDFQVQ